MVAPEEKFARKLGTAMLAGSFLGAFLSLLSVSVLGLLGANLTPWPLGFDGWWQGDYPWLRFLAGAGILLLAAIPILMVMTVAARAPRARFWKNSLVTGGLLLILALAVILARARRGQTPALDTWSIFQDLPR